MTLKDHIINNRNKLCLIKDILLLPENNSRKVKKAVKSYVPGRNIGSEQVLLLVDNTILRSGKQGMMITQGMLYSFSNISGNFSIPLNEIESISPQVRKALGIPQIGIVVNRKYFISLPGMTEENTILRDYIEWNVVLGNEELSVSIIYFALFLHKALGCKIILKKEEDPGHPPWY